ncbi:MAG: PEP-CTERM sorting domain-containing protein [Pacificimonas sp.]|jgi:hypothetical protein|nr:PEP-CTERM sorting domain-containing protein [Pacificimonas sp.]
MFASFKFASFKTAALAAAFTLSAAPAAAGIVYVEFEDLPTTSLASTTTAGPLTFSLFATGGDGPIGFDTNCGNPGVHACNGDTDLIPLTNPDSNGVAGKVLIIQEPGSARPDDQASGGSLTLRYDLGPSTVFFTGFSGIDDTTFNAFGPDNSLIATLSMTNNSETGSVNFAPVAINLGDTIRFTLTSSGGLDRLQFLTPAQQEPVPAPAALGLLGLGFAAIGLRRRTRRD